MRWKKKLIAIVASSSKSFRKEQDESGTSDNEKPNDK